MRALVVLCSIVPMAVLCQPLCGACASNVIGCGSDAGTNLNLTQTGQNGYIDTKHNSDQECSENNGCTQCAGVQLDLGSSVVYNYGCIGSQSDCEDAGGVWYENGVCEWTFW